jgi:hypothetical protein
MSDCWRRRREEVSWWTKRGVLALKQTKPDGDNV